MKTSHSELLCPFPFRKFQIQKLKKLESRLTGHVDNKGLMFIQQPRAQEIRRQRSSTVALLELHLDDVGTPDPEVILSSLSGMIPER